MESESDNRNCQESESDDETSDSTALDITLLDQSVNLICAKNLPIAPIGLNIFFFASTAESRATF